MGPQGAAQRLSPLVLPRRRRCVPPFPLILFLLRFVGKCCWVSSLWWSWKTGTGAWRGETRSSSSPCPSSPGTSSSRCAPWCTMPATESSTFLHLRYHCSLIRFDLLKTWVATRTHKALRFIQYTHLSCIHSCYTSSIGGMNKTTKEPLMFLGYFLLEDAHIFLSPNFHLRQYKSVPPWPTPMGSLDIKVWAIADSKRQGYLGFFEFMTAMQVCPWYWFYFISASAHVNIFLQLIKGYNFERMEMCSWYLWHRQGRRSVKTPLHMQVYLIHITG